MTIRKRCNLACRIILDHTTFCLARRRVIKMDRTAFLLSEGSRDEQDVFMPNADAASMLIIEYFEWYLGRTVL